MFIAYWIIGGLIVALLFGGAAHAMSKDKDSAARD